MLDSERFRLHYQYTIPAFRPDPAPDLADAEGERLGYRWRCMISGWRLVE